MPSETHSSVVLFSSLAFLILHGLARLGVIQVEEIMLSASMYSFTAWLGLYCWKLSTVVDRESRRLSEITNSVYRVLNEHDQRLPPLT